MLGVMVAKGKTAEIYEYGKDKVIKLFKEGFPFELCRLEFQIATSLTAHHVACPVPYALIEIEGRDGIVYERLKGVTMRKKMRELPWTAKKQARLLARYHQALHLPTKAELLTVKQKLMQQISVVAELTAREKEQLYSCLMMLPDGDALCHFDLHPGNVMYKKGQPMAIDWLTAARGDSLADVARTCMLLKYAQRRKSSALHSKRPNLYSDRVAKAYLAEYLALSGCQLEDIQRWELPVMAARLSEGIPQAEREQLLQMVRKGLPEYSFKMAMAS